MNMMRRRRRLSRRRRCGEADNNRNTDRNKKNAGQRRNPKAGGPAVNRNGQRVHVTVHDQPARPAQPVLRFAPDAWAKLLWLRDRGDTEVGGFGITAADDPLRVIEFVTVHQQCTAVSVVFDDDAVADYFQDQLKAGRRPEQCGRVWVHTHPGQSAAPSGIDEDTFARVFGVCDWAVMCIVAKQGARYARLRFNVGPGADKRIAVRVDHVPPFGAADPEAWEAEYLGNIHREDELEVRGKIDVPKMLEQGEGEACGDIHGNWLDQFELDPEIRALIEAEEAGGYEVPFSDIDHHHHQEQEQEQEEDQDT